MTRFDRIAEGLNVAPLLAAIRPAMWDEITLRQDYEGSAHKDTQAIFLRGPTNPADPFGCTTSEAYPPMGELHAPFCDLLDAIPLDTSEIGRVMLVSLKPGGVIAEHCDEGAYAERFSRFHVALQSKPGNVFTCGLEAAHMQPGECWWFDHRASHKVRNYSSQPRIHLIFDARVSGLYRKEA